MFRRISELKYLIYCLLANEHFEIRVQRLQVHYYNIYVHAIYIHHFKGENGNYSC